MKTCCVGITRLEMKCTSWGFREVSVSFACFEKIFSFCSKVYGMTFVVELYHRGFVSRMDAQALCELIFSADLKVGDMLTELQYERLCVTVDNIFQSVQKNGMFLN